MISTSNFQDIQKKKVKKKILGQKSEKVFPKHKKIFGEFGVTHPFHD